MTVAFEKILRSFGEVRDSNPFASSEWIEREQNKILHCQKHDEPVSGFKSLLLTFITRLAGNQSSIRIFDFGGGTGFLYFALAKKMLGKNLQWNVIDNASLCSIGQALYKRFRHEYEKGDTLPALYFYENLTQLQEKSFDVINISTALQYIEEPYDLLEKMLEFKPRYFFLTRTITTRRDSFIVAQNILGEKIACRFLNEEKLIRFFQSEGFRLCFENNAEENLWNQFADNIPMEFRSRSTRNLFFESTGAFDKPSIF